MDWPAESMTLPDPIVDWTGSTPKDIESNWASERLTEGVVLVRSVASALAELAGQAVVVPLEWPSQGARGVLWGAVASVLDVGARATGAIVTLRTEEAAGQLHHDPVHLAQAVVRDWQLEQGPAPAQLPSCGVTLRHQGRNLPPKTVALNAAYPSPTPRLAVFIHGHGETEDVWNYHADDERTFGARLSADLGYTPVWVRLDTRYSTAASSQALSNLLDRVVSVWPTHVRRIALIGHGRGGAIAQRALVSRPRPATADPERSGESGQSGTRMAPRPGWAWLVRDTVLLGTWREGVLPDGAFGALRSWSGMHTSLARLAWLARQQAATMDSAPDRQGSAGAPEDRADQAGFTGISADHDQPQVQGRSRQPEPAEDLAGQDRSNAGNSADLHRQATEMATTHGSWHWGDHWSPGAVEGRRQLLLATVPATPDRRIPSSSRDLIVVPLAFGNATDRSRFIGLPEERIHVPGGFGPQDLLTHPVVYEYLRAWLHAPEHNGG